MFVSNSIKLQKNKNQFEFRLLGFDFLNYDLMAGEGCHEIR